jgi:hypothetical protein
MTGERKTVIKKGVQATRKQSRWQAVHKNLREFLVLEVKDKREKPPLSTFFKHRGGL